MTCTEISNSLSLYMDGQLPGAQHTQVAEHLRRCDTCAAELESLRALSAMLFSLPGAELSVDLAPAVVTRANSVTFTDRLVTLWNQCAQHRRLFGRQLTRAVVIVMLVALAAAVPGRGPSDLLRSLPAKVTGAGATGFGYLVTGMGSLQRFIDELRSPDASKRASAQRGDHTRLSPHSAVEVAGTTFRLTTWRHE